MNLEDVARKHGADKFEHGYCPHYQAHLPHRLDKFTMLEIGVAKGASMFMWHEWFKNATIIGIDNNPDILDIPNDGFTLFHSDGTRQHEQLDTYKFDIVIDDGSHTSGDIIKSFKLYWPKLNSGGIYVVEDLATQFDQFWEGRPNGSDATDIIANMLLKTYRQFGISEFHAYREIVFMKKDQ